MMLTFSSFCVNFFTLGPILDSSTLLLTLWDLDFLPSLIHLPHRSTFTSNACQLSSLLLLFPLWDYQGPNGTRTINVSEWNQCCNQGLGDNWSLDRDRIIFSKLVQTGRYWSCCRDYSKYNLASTKDQYPTDKCFLNYGPHDQMSQMSFQSWLILICNHSSRVYAIPFTELPTHTKKKKNLICTLVTI